MKAFFISALQGLCGRYFAKFTILNKHDGYHHMMDGFSHLLFSLYFLFVYNFDLIMSFYQSVYLHLHLKGARNNIKSYYLPLLLFIFNQPQSGGNFPLNFKAQWDTPCISRTMFAAVGFDWKRLEYRRKSV